MLGSQRQHNDLHVRPPALDAPRGLQAIHSLHPDVHQDGIWALFCHQLHRLVPICRLADTNYLRPKGEQGLETLTHRAPIIYD